VQPQIVAVIASAADLRSALELQTPPDLFELRLDRFVPDFAELEKLHSPFIITARHWREGGARGLGVSARRALLLRFLSHARFVDVELRSVHWLRQVLERAGAAGVNTIISHHDLHATPSLSELRRKLRAVTDIHPAIFKVATRVDEEAQLARLLAFFDEARAVLPTAAMGIGKLGRRSRLELARRGSVLQYAYLARRQAPGQLSLAEALREAV
jgi:3-dehydroquinate dehydratase-1